MSHGRLLMVEGAVLCFLYDNETIYANNSRNTATLVPFFEF